MKYGKGKRIKRLRKAEGLTQVQLAERIGVTKQNLYKYENGIITNIPTDKIEKIAEVFGSSPAYIMGWSEIPYEKEGLSNAVGLPSLDDDEKELLSNYSTLNPTGKTEARKQVKNLTYIPEYVQDAPDPDAVIAAHNDNTDLVQLEKMKRDVAALLEDD